MLAAFVSDKPKDRLTRILQMLYGGSHYGQETTMHNNWNDRDCSTLELRAAIEYWAGHHNQGSRNRVRAAIGYYRAWHHN